MTEVIATPTAPGVVLVECPALRLAKDYRVTWTPQNAESAARMQAERAKTVFVTQTKCALPDVPLGEGLACRFQARKRTSLPSGSSVS